LAEDITVRSKDIEALQQELDSLQKCYAVTNENWKKLQQENEQLRCDNMNSEMNLEHMTDLYEQLQAQAARMREALEIAESRFKVIEQATEYVKPGTGVWHTVGIALQEIQQFYKTISGTPVAYHNPADVVALKQARGALEFVMDEAEFENEAEGARARKPVREALPKIAEVVGE